MSTWGCHTNSIWLFQFFSWVGNIGCIVCWLSAKRKRIVGKLWWLFMNNLIWTPILVLFLISCFDGERRSLDREVWLARLFRLNFVPSKFSLMLSFLFNIMRIDDLMLFLNIKRLKLMRFANCFHSIIASVLSLVLRMHTFRIMIPDMLINHLSSSWSSHIVLIILNKVNRSFLRRRIKSISYSLLCIIIVLPVLNNLLILLSSYWSRWT